MGAKKKKVKSESSETKKIDEAPKPIPVRMENWINIDFKLLNWKYMNFSMKFREDTHIFTIKRLLQERHGRMDDLKICFNSFADINEVTDEMLTLRECGLKGHPINTLIMNSKEPAAVEEVRSIPLVPLFYDFKPNNFSDPVILYFK